MTNNKFNILVIDDEDDILEFISYNLRKEGYHVNTACNGLKAIDVAKKNHPHLILLDLMMPEMDGITTCELFRSIPSFSETLVALLTASSADDAQIAGLIAGADDYIIKPIKPKLLSCKIRALLRRHKIVIEENRRMLYNYSHGGIQIDKEKHRISVNGIFVDFPRKEFYLLQLLTTKPSRVFTRQEIYRHIWGQDNDVSDRTIDVYIRKIREKIGDHRIKTIKGIGYRYIETDK